MIAAMGKLSHEWPRPELPAPLSIQGIAALDVPVLNMRAAATTLAASCGLDLLGRALSDATYSEIAHAGRVSPVTHPSDVNPATARILDMHAD